ncbi:MAG TPA: histidine kinase dimerization/phospho-acceptor domain-containing protein [Gaiellaceae bacterium]|nr:histidine kinase dimerization/phospho-acceptor domain-containing protein [Gaiellaceae bacterium]
MPEDPQFARLVMLACHDLRTPLATVHGFAQTLVRMQGFDEATVRYLGMIDSASAQIAELIDELSLGARIEAGRYDPVLGSANTIELAHAAAEVLGEERVAVAGEGAEIDVDVDASRRAVASLAQCALRHGGQERVELTVEGEELRLAPITPASAPVVLGEDLRDLGAAVAVRQIRAQGGSVALEGDTLRVRLA